jgi:hypothetical protein
MAFNITAVLMIDFSFTTVSHKHHPVLHIVSKMAVTGIVLVVEQVTFYPRGNMAALFSVTCLLPVAGVIFKQPYPWVF